MSVPHSGVVLGLLAGALLACGGPPPRASESKDATPAAVAYDVASDPLVNPPALFEAYPAADPARVADDETLVRYLFSNPVTLNPLFAANWDEQYLAEALFDPLVLRDARLEPVWNPDLVDGVATRDGGTVFDVTLRDGTRWSDGAPVTAADVAWSFAAIRDARVTALAWKQPAAALDRVLALDPRTVRFVHREPLATAMESMRFPVVPRHVYGDQAERAADPSLRTSPYYNRVNREGIVGNGPYRLVEWRPGDRLILERRGDFHSTARRPAFHRVVWKVQADRNLALLELVQGQIDEMILNPQQFATQTSDPEFARVAVKGYAPLPRVVLLSWNLHPTKPLFQDPRVRLALAHAYPAEAVLRVVSHGLYHRFTGLFGHGHWAADPTLEPVTLDREEASRLLDEAGWTPSPEDGWRRRTIGDAEVRLSFEVLSPVSFATGLLALVPYQEELRKLGVEMRVRPVEAAAFERQLRDGDFDAYLQVADNVGDPDQWSAYLAGDGSGPRNYVGYRNARVDELFRAGRRELDRSRRGDLYREIDRIVHQEQPFLPLWQAALLWAFNRRLRGVQFSPAGPFLFTPDAPPGAPGRFGPGWWVARSS